MQPKARGDLLLTDLDDELIVYDPNNHNGHNLNKTSMLVFEHCDGQHSEQDLARMLELELNIEDGGELAKLALNQLTKKGLFEANSVPDKPTVTRRDMLTMARSMGLTIALLPVAQTIVVPTPAAAASGAAIAPDCQDDSLGDPFGFWDSSCSSGASIPVHNGTIPDPDASGAGISLGLDSDPGGCIVLGGSGPARQYRCRTRGLASSLNYRYWDFFYINDPGCTLCEICEAYGLSCC